MMRLYRIWHKIYWTAYVLNKLGDFIEACREMYKAIRDPEGEGRPGGREGKRRDG